MLDELLWWGASTITPIILLKKDNKVKKSEIDIMANNLTIAKTAAINIINALTTTENTADGDALLFTRIETVRVAARTAINAATDITTITSLASNATTGSQIILVKAAITAYINSIITKVNKTKFDGITDVMIKAIDGIVANKAIKASTLGNPILTTTTLNGLSNVTLVLKGIITKDDVVGTYSYVVAISHIDDGVTSGRDIAITYINGFKTHDDVKIATDKTQYSAYGDQTLGNTSNTRLSDGVISLNDLNALNGMQTQPSLTTGVTRVFTITTDIKTGIATILITFYATNGDDDTETFTITRFATIGDEIKNAANLKIANDKALFNSFNKTILEKPSIFPNGTITANDLNAINGVALPPITTGVTRAFTIATNVGTGIARVTVTISATNGDDDTTTFTIKRFKSTYTDIKTIINKATDITLDKNTDISTKVKLIAAIKSKLHADIQTLGISEFNINVSSLNNDGTVQDVMITILRNGVNTINIIKVTVQTTSIMNIATDKALFN